MIVNMTQNKLKKKVFLHFKQKQFDKSQIKELQPIFNGMCTEIVSGLNSIFEFLMYYKCELACSYKLSHI